MINSKIQWTNDTWNPWHGCLKVSSGCKNCYMYRDKKRWGQDGAVIKRSSDTIFNSPYHMVGPLVFTCSWSDFFIREADPWREETWNIIRNTKHLTYQILTKRADRILVSLPKDWGHGWDNVWLGVSVETQAQAWRMDYLRSIPCGVRFVSCEPLLGPLNLNLHGFSWVITGGESGPGARPAKTDWFLSIKDQCNCQGVKFFHKQNGGNTKKDGAWGGRDLNGQVYQEFPINQ